MVSVVVEASATKAPETSDVSFLETKYDVASELAVQLKVIETSFFDVTAKSVGAFGAF